jgi:hypothetical protein
MAWWRALKRRVVRCSGIWARALYTVGSSTKKRGPCNTWGKMAGEYMLAGKCHQGGVAGCICQAGLVHRAHLGRVNLPQLILDDHSHVGRALKGPLPVQLPALGQQGQLAPIWHHHQAVLEGGQLARVMTTQDRLHVYQRYQDLSCLVIFQQQVPAQGGSP